MSLQYCLHICVLLSIGNALESNDFCTQKPNTGPSIPEMFQKSFIAKIAGKIVEKKKSVYATETMSLEANKMSLFWTMADQNQFFIYDKTKQEIISGSDGFNVTHKRKVKTFIGNAEINDRSTLQLMISYCGVAPDDSQPAQLAMFSSNVFHGDVEYINKTVVRGIPVDHWQKCMSLPNLMNFTLDLYVTDNNVYWNMPTLLPYVPVRVELNGVVFTNGTLEPAHHVYDYITFEQFQGDEHNSAFEPPAGVLCPGSPPEIALPKMPSTLIFHRETSVSSANYVDDGLVIYDTVDQVCRSDFFDGASLIREIRDFNEGVMYRIDSNKDSCDMKSITEDGGPGLNGMSLDINVPYTFDDFGYVHMQSVDSYFLANGNFTYEGEQLVRGVPCDLFSQRLENHKGYTLSSTLISLYFSKKGIDMYHTEGQSTAIQNQLMRVTMSNSQESIWSDIYNLAQDSWSRGTPFDISDCFNASTQMSFTMSFDGGDLEPQYYSTFSQLASKAVAQLGVISPVRVKLDEIKVILGNVTVEGKIFEKTPNYALYTKSVGKRLNTSLLPDRSQPLVYSDNFIDAATCATYCSRDLSHGWLPVPILTMYECDSYDYFNSNGTCFLYPKITNKSYIVFIDDPTVDHYQRSVNGPQPTLIDNAWPNLINGVAAGNLKVTFATTDQKMRTYTARTFTDLNTRSNFWAEEDLSSLLKDYDEIPGLKMRGAIIERKGVSRTTCAKMCSDTSVLQCVSLTYCEFSKTCTLHDVKVELSKTNYPVTLGCSSYTRSPMTNYDKDPIRGAPEFVHDLAYFNIDQDECAYKCLSNTEFPCRAFAYCITNGGQCYLDRNETGVFDEKKNPDCSVYSSTNLLRSFDMITDMVTNHAVWRNYGFSSASYCSLMCFRVIEFKCSTFQFCGSTKSCQILNLTVQSSSELTLVPKPGCLTFIKRNFIEKKDIPKKQKMRINGYSEGAMGGVAVGMMIAGAVLTQAGVVIYSHARRTKLSNTDNDTGTLTMDDITQAE